MLWVGKVVFSQCYYRKGAIFPSRSFTILYAAISIQRSIAESSANPSSLSRQASEAREPFAG